MKAYTDIEQSKKLAEILPPESADMFHFIHEVDTVGFEYKKDAEEFYSKTKFEYIPCWSLAALLDILPNNENISTNLSKGGYRISNLEYINNWFVDYEDETNGFNNCVTSADNPIDACVAMIEKLHELNLL